MLTRNGGGGGAGSRGRGRGRRGGGGRSRPRASGAESSAESPAPQASVAVEPGIETSPIVPITVIAPVARDMTTLIRDMKKLGADVFGGGTDYLKADHWLRNLKNCFKYVSCTELEKAKLAAFFLNGEAREWWDTLERHPNFLLLNLEGFEALFLEKYFSTSVRVKLQMEFFQLVQGTMTVREYETKFFELYRFSQRLGDFELARMFEKGLNDKIQEQVNNHVHPTVALVLRSAEAAEQQIENHKKMVDSTKESKEKRNLHLAIGDSSGTQGGTWKKQKTHEWRQGRRGGVAEAPNRGNQQAETAVRCYNCNELGHVAPNCTKPRGNVCYNCGQAGHISRNCPQPRRNQNRQPAQEQQQGGGNARVFALGQRGARSP